MSRDPGAPRWYEDIPWRFGYRGEWLGYTFLGPAQLEGDSDPLRVCDESAGVGTPSGQRSDACRSDGSRLAPMKLG